MATDAETAAVRRARKAELAGEVSALSEPIRAPGWATRCIACQSAGR